MTLASTSMSALSAMLPSWSTVLLVLLVAILLLSYWVVRGISVETILASCRLVSQGQTFCYQITSLAKRLSLCPQNSSACHVHTASQGRISFTNSMILNCSLMWDRFCAHWKL